jgi:5-methyltetrahydropteroyltriglutamate--homocysteine methyltransferase
VNPRPLSSSVIGSYPQPDWLIDREALGTHSVVVLGVLDLGDPQVESPHTVAERIRAALAHVPADRLVAAPDCGMKYLPRTLAFAKLQALSAGAARVRAEL